jgi:hypothetical protein
MMSSRHRWLTPALAILLAAVACTTVTNDFLQEVGTTKLFVTDTDLQPQSITDQDEPIQVAEWELLTADLELDGSPTVADMLFEDTCRFTDTVYTSPTPEGRCSSGLVVGANEDTSISATLTMTFNMWVRRAEPVLLSPEGDYDTDEVTNQADICPYIRNPDQEDENSDGLGDACVVRDPVSGVLLPDADGDGWPDILDNCVWTPNPAQTDAGVGTGGIPDGIGDACTEQLVTVSTPPLGIQRSVELTQLQYQVTYLTVDFLSGSSLINCDWESGSCELDPSQVQVCINDSFSSAARGCP